MLADRYDPKETEPRIQKFWEENKVFSFDSKSKNNVYSIDTPPPTISGQLHMGHAFSYSQAEFIARFWRMRGFNVFYPMGFDNNGLATDLLTEKTKNIKAEFVGREKFIQAVMEVTKERQQEYTKIWKTLGISCDWSLLYTTIDPAVQKLSQWSFIQLYKQKRAYMKDDATIWCVRCKTAIAQAEMEDKEKEGTLNYIDLDVLGMNRKITIATTRPELMPACVAIFVNPSDKRYDEFVGEEVYIPFFNRSVPILADSTADPSKGTGAVYVCTFGDYADVEWVRSHKLPIIYILNRDGTLNEKAGPYSGLRIEEARQKIIEDLKAQGKLVKQEKIKHIVNMHERCGTEIELIVTDQWFIRYLDLKEEFLKMGEKIIWHPPHMYVRYRNWVSGLKWDWCISRQRFYGIPFPVWYCLRCGETKVADEKDLPVNPLKDKPHGKCICGSTDFIPEQDIMDTWATSGLTPMINSHWLDKNNLNKKILPIDLRPQAHDIINFWAFYTIVKSYFHRKDIPFKHIMISGHGLDQRGDKMSKSKGNVVLPLAVVEKYSADSLRFWASSAKLGDDMPYQEKDVATGQKLLNKLWSAARLIEPVLAKPPAKKPELRAIDKWLLRKLSILIAQSTKEYENCEYSSSKAATEQLFWHDFCDNYLELVKARIYAGDKAAAWTLYTTYLTFLKLFNPITPHICEELYQLLFRKREKSISINLSGWPEPILKDKRADSWIYEAGGNFALIILSEVRQWKHSKGLPLNAELFALKIACPEAERKAIEAVKEELLSATKAKSLIFMDGKEISVEVQQ
ncbi:MAG: valine--tRNA ligase [Candidatus Aenigmarchaeota archaeon]|nr:valine--tRNA ligase [Candidatus Aenigmarchaeota archaeon]